MKNLKLKSARAALDLSQQQLAEKVGVSRQTINAIEKGDYIPILSLSISMQTVIYTKLTKSLIWYSRMPAYSGCQIIKSCCQS